MQRRVFLLLAAILTVPAFAKAAVIGAEQAVYEYAPGTDIANINIMLSLGSGEQYTDSTLRTLTNGGGSGPAITSVFGDDTAAVSAPLLVGSIWAGGNAGIGLAGEGTTAQGNGRNTLVIYTSPGAPDVSSSLEGVHTALTFTIAGLAPGDYLVDLAGTNLNNGFDDNFDPVPVPLTVNNFTIRIVPEPSTLILGGLGVVGMAAVAIRRRRRAA